jgi:hypothetical protein
VSAVKRVLIHHWHKGDTAAHERVVAGEKADEPTDREDGLELIPVDSAGDEESWTAVVCAEEAGVEIHGPMVMPDCLTVTKATAKEKAKGRVSAIGEGGCPHAIPQPRALECRGEYRIYICD